MEHNGSEKFWKMRTIFIALISVFVTACKNHEGDVIIVPNKYTGYIIIIHGQSSPKSQEYTGRRIIYRIPKSGILQTRFSVNEDWVKFPNFYYGDINTENKIYFESNPSKIPDSIHVASGGSIYTTGGNTKNKLTYTVYYIGNRAQTNKAFLDVESINPDILLRK
ncbi:DUF6843 domain-containing protein [Hymenobacter canadensis]|uniref:DUF6843 domain-containing protein n=1 Tax=Hymenobacter canadensis TaxID=2999067 RepID=A0ABY7LVK6_9BACT|nr:hypothetical protein [Hymenobacter canadensis]WBA44391.1 hypothetical protein O3303_21815 [Hymenobacter canadensis]